VLAAVGLPPATEAGGVRAAFLVLAVLCAATALVAFVGLRTRPHGPELAADLATVDPLRDRRIWSLSAGSALLTCVQSSLVGFTVLYLHSEHGLSTTEAGAVLAAMQVLGAGGRIAAGRWSDRRGDRMWPLRAITAVLVVAVAVTAVLAAASTGPVVAALVVAGGVAMSWNALSFTAVAELAGRARSGAALGLQQSVLAVANSITPPVFAVIAAAASWQAAYAVVAACPIAALVVFRAAEGTAEQTDALDPA
jgi:predicted MFS family arabinose efflux permease